MKTETAPVPVLHFVQDTNRYGLRNEAHINDGSDKTLCRKAINGTVLYPADWEAIHYRIPFGGLCPKCQKAAALRLRPKAKFQFLDNWYGEVREFETLREAETAARDQYGSVAIYQLGPAETNKIVEFVQGRDMPP